MNLAYYNEIDPFAAEWLQNLIQAGLIMAGDIDQRDIRDVRPSDLRGYARCHFFAGIGGWDYALQLAGWPDDRPVWTGSCPCQPFSAAGKGAGFDDERHLWPAWHWLIQQCRPAIVFGEQVAAKAVEPWIDLVSLDLEALGYSVGAIAFPAASVGAPHIRDRLSFVADAEGAGGWPLAGGMGGRPAAGIRGEEGQNIWRPGKSHGLLVSGSPDGLVADAGGARAGRHPGTALGAEACGGSARRPDGGICGDASVASSAVRKLADAVPAGRAERRAGAGIGSSAGSCGAGLGMADAHGRHASAERQQRGGEHGQQPQDGGAGFWSAADWLPCRDGKARPVEPGTFPLAHGIPGRVGRLRAYGNAIVPQAQAEFIRAYLG